MGRVANLITSGAAREPFARQRHALDRFGKTGAGDIRKLTVDKQGRFRIRVGTWRIILRREGRDAFRVYSVDDRKDAYRA